jgi:UDPglucose 6-dehydrogenase/GDP-mannose 6-dehydrogenase
MREDGRQKTEDGSESMKVAVIGTGYVGLVSAAGLAEMGHEVTCVDIDPERVAMVERGKAPIHEPGLDDLITSNRDRIGATTDLGAAVNGADLTLICVGTPSRPDGSIDLSFVERAARQVGEALAGKTRFHAVVVKSTVVPGSTDTVVLPAVEGASGRSVGVDIGVGVNPEFLTEGQAVDDFLRPDRIVIGGDPGTVEVLRRLYEPFAGVPVIATTTRNAEMIKYASNALLATAISFANEIADLGSAIGEIDVAEVMAGVHASRYLTTTLADGERIRAGLAPYLEAGCGYGGSCLPKDVAALISRGLSTRLPMPLLTAVATVNRQRADRLTALVGDGLGSLEGKKVTVLGLAFKPDTDDTRESPAFPVLRRLVEAGAEVTVHDPVVGPGAVAGFPDVEHTHDLDTAVKGADAVVIVTRWSDYLELPTLLDDPAQLVVDGRRMLDPNSVSRYRGIGR